MRNQSTPKQNRRTRNGGYTMMELLTVIGIIAIVCAIAIPSVFLIHRSLKFRQHNDYAKSIFLAAQANLTEMRSNGGLSPLQAHSDGSMPEGNHEITDSRFPTESWAGEYVYTTSRETSGLVFQTVLPANSVDATVLDQQIIIEYNPYTGNVYAVFYSEDESVLDTYRSGGLPRDTEDEVRERKSMMLGYYCGSGLSSAELELERMQTTMTFENGEEGMVTVRVPVPEQFFSDLNGFEKGLDVTLTVKGDLGGSFEIHAKPQGTQANCTSVAGNAILIRYPLDSLAAYRSFANYSTGLAPAFDLSNPAAGETGGESVTNLKSEKTAFYNGVDPFDGTSPKPARVLPGDNVTITASIRFDPDTTVEIEPAVLAGINPMFNYVRRNGEGKLVVSVTNGRNLQNLNAIAPSIGVNVDAVLIEDDIYWNRTVDYYNSTYGTGSPKVYQNTTEAPARALPYFVPIHSESLFGTARFVFPGEGDGGIGGILGQIMGNLVDWADSALNIQPSKKVPTLTDFLDLKRMENADDPIRHAVIEGNHKKIYFLNINSNAYGVPARVEEGVDNGRQFYAAGNQQIDYYFSGLFGYVNTPISNLSVVNPIVRGHAFDDGEKKVPIYGLSNDIRDWLEGKFITITGYRKVNLYNNPATGALVGAAGYNTLITNCNTYIDTTVEGFSRAAMNQGDFATSDQAWYGVSGEGAVGGLVGYAKSHRTVTGDLTHDKDYLAFSEAFAAVPVSGNMRGANTDKDFGYSNGVGGLLGNSQLTNFYNCYASGNVRARNGYLKNTPLGSFAGGLADAVNKLFGYTIEIPYDGRTGQGAGGFVGTSHGTRYTNCYATGAVRGNVSAAPAQKLCVGGFVGVMSMDETLAFGHDQDSSGNNRDEINIAQRTIFTDCYSVGLATIDGNPVENFSGANARIKLDASQTGAMITGDYYRLVAPRYAADSKHELPGYSDIYLFRNSYYLSQYYKDEQENSNNCANPETYDTLTDLPGNHRDEVWRNQRIDAIKSIKLYPAQRHHPKYDWIPGDWIDLTYRERYFEGFDGYVFKFPANDPGLTERYHDLYASQYQNGWGAPSAATTHGYDLALLNAVYPFTKLAGMDYYGNWPSRPSAAGLAYYEQYEGETDQIHYYYDRDDTSTLRNDKDAVVSKDGYVIFAANNEIKVKVADGAFTTMHNTGTAEPDSSNKYNTFPLTDAQMQQAAKYCEEHQGFYAPISIRDGGKTYTVYFNPNVALTQVNPVDENLHASEPSKAPTQLFIRSARQLAGLANMAYAWSPEYNYVQMLHVDFEHYQMPNNKILRPKHPIGTAEKPFLGTYDGALGYVEQAEIRGLDQKDSLFGVLGDTAKVQNLHLLYTKTAENKHLTVGGAENPLTALVAADNQGLLQNVDLTLNKQAELTAKESTGLLAARSSGRIADCDIGIDAKNPIVLTAPVSGTVIGETTGGVMENVTLNATPVSGSGILGGFVGSSEKTDYKNISLNCTGLNTSGSMLGGFAGTLEGVNAEQIRVYLSGEYRCDAGLLGGFAGTVGTTEIPNLTDVGVVVQKDAMLSGKNAAGFFGNADSVSLTAADVVVEGSIRASEQAAGFANTLGGKVTNSAVRLSAADISGAVEAAGFANQLVGQVENIGVIGTGTVSSEGTASGFAGTVSGKAARCRVTPAVSESAAGYLNNSNENLKITGMSTAGFASVVNSGASVENANALASLDGDASGFVGTNAGTVDGCIANVTMQQGAGFTQGNTGAIRNCIGWFEGNPDLTVTAEQMGSCTGSYFANLSIPETDTNPDSVWLFDNKGAMQPMKPSGLSGVSPEVLNADPAKWYAGGQFGAWPYDPLLAEESYRYPMLREFPGNWAVPPRYPYGVTYYEHYEDGSWKVHMLDLADPQTTVEKKSLSGYVEIAANQTTSEASIFNADGTITEAGYALFCKDGVNPFGTEPLTAITDAPVYLGSGYQLNFYQLTAADDIQNFTDEAGVEHTVDTRFADAIDETDAFELRTSGHLAKMTADGSFLQTHDITADALPMLESFSGSYQGSEVMLTVKNGTTWITDLSGSISGVKLDVTGDVTGSLFGAVAQSGKLNLSGVSLGSIDQTGSLIGTLTGSFDCPAVSVSGNANAALIGTVTGSFNCSQVTVAGETTGIFGNVNAELKNVAVSAGTLKDPVIGEATANLTNVAVTAESAYVKRAVLLPVADHITLDGCKVSVTNDVTLHGADKKPLGVLVGEQIKGTIQNCEVSCGTVTIEGENGKTVIAGGMAGSSTGTISGGSVDANIRYIQPAVAEGQTDTAILGGIVGQSSGTVTDTTVIGSIELVTPAKNETTEPTDPTVPSDPTDPTGSTDPTDAATAGLTDPTDPAETTGLASQPETKAVEPHVYTVGGAVGEDLGGAYTGIVSTVAVSETWKSGDGTATAEEPAGYGAVGKFVGHVTKGSFKNCSAMDSQQTPFQFLGRIDVTEHPVKQPSFVGKRPDLGGTKTVENQEKFRDFEPAAENAVYHNFAAVLENCIFDGADGTHNRQEIQKTAYYYERSALDKSFEHKAAEVTNPFDAGQKLTYEAFKGNGQVSDKELTEYYFKDSENIFKQVKVTRLWNKKDRYWTFKLFVDGTKSPIANKPFKKETTFDAPVKSGKVSLIFYTLTLDSQQTKYLLVQNNQMLTADGTKIPYSTNQFYTDASVLWTPTMADSKISWTNGSSYLQAEGTVDSAPTELYVDSVNGGTIHMSNGAKKKPKESVFQLYTVAQTGNYRCTATFTPIDGAFHEAVTAVPAPKNLSEIPAGAAGGEIG